MKETENRNTNTKETVEKFNGEEEINQTENTKYLGQIISNDGTNIKNIENRSQKRNWLSEQKRYNIEKHPRREISF